MNKKFLVVTNTYPSTNNKYANGFIHTRVKKYMQKNIHVTVWINSNSEFSEYEYEGVVVRCGKLSKEYCDSYNVDHILCHFIDRKMITAFKSIPDIPITIWFHGVECLKWHRRLFEFKKNRIEFMKYIFANELQLFILRKFLVENNKRVTAIFVSNWMKSIATKDINYAFENYEIVPNPIDNKLFSYHEKPLSQRRKILVIRPFSSNKYSTDLIVDTIKSLNELGHYELEYEVYGKGPLWDNQTKELKEFKNVKCHNKFLNHEEIAEVHKKNGIFLCPTRQDAQGVSMCEAMSSGLVPISTYCTAIPEFVEKNTGILVTPESKEELVAAILKVANNEMIFEELSKNASQSIQKKCGIDFIIEHELKILNEV